VDAAKESPKRAQKHEWVMAKVSLKCTYVYKESVVTNENDTGQNKAHTVRAVIELHAVHVV
jgi:hypothetical protein